MLLNGGLGDLARDSRLMEKNEATVAVNVDLRKEEGALHAAKANLLLNTLTEGILGINKFLDKLLIHTDGKLYYDNLTTSKRTLSKTIPMSVVNYEGQAYIADGVNFLKTADGSTYSTPFIAAPSSSGITAAISTGSITAFAAKSTGSITAFSDPGGGKTTVKSAAHGLVAGEQVVISGTTSYNGQFELYNVTTDTFDIIVVFVADDATGTWAKIGQIVVKSAAHGLSNNVEVVISGTTNYNGTEEVSNVTTNTFEIAATWVADDATGTWEEVGELQKGTYKLVFTLAETQTALAVIDRDESPPSAIVTLKVANNDRKIKLSGLPVTSSYNLVYYRWLLGGGDNFSYATEITDSSTTYTDNLSYAELGHDIKTIDYETPAVPAIIKRFNNNLFLLGIRGWRGISQDILDNYLMYSDDKRFCGYSRHMLLRVGDTGDKIMNGEVLGVAFCVYTKGGVYLISGVNSADYRHVKTRATTGLAAHYALVNTITHGHLLLGSDRRLHLFNGSDFVYNESLRKMDNLFDKTSEYPYRMNWDERSKCRMEYFDEMARLAYPSAGKIENDKYLNMDFRYWPEIRFTITDIAATAFYADKINNVMYVGDDDGSLKEVEAGTTYLAPILKPKNDDKNNVHADKAFDEILIDYDSKGKDITLALEIDGAVNNTITANKNGRGKKEVINKSYASPNKGYQTTMQISWNEPDTDVVVYAVETVVEMATTI